MRMNYKKIIVLKKILWKLCEVSHKGGMWVKQDWILKVNLERMKR